MNKVFLIGRLVRNPEVRYSQGEPPIAVAKYSLAVPRKIKRQNEQECDFINCVAFGKNGEFAEKYLHKGTKILVTGHIQTGSYIHKESGQKIYTTDVIVEEHEFCESKSANNNQSESTSETIGNNDWMSIPDGVDAELPFV